MRSDWIGAYLINNHDVTILRKGPDEDGTYVSQEIRG